jgi:HEPN domain-containing protein
MPPKEELARGWLVKAQRDLEMANRALEEAPRLPDMACFHSHQTIEKALKAVLLYRGIQAPRTHVLDTLLKLCGPIDPRFDLLAPQLSLMTEFAVEGRYPDTGCEPNLDEAREALRLAREAYDIIVSALPTEVLP